MKLYNVAYSGNSYKVRLLLAQLGIPCEIADVDILRGESRTPEFLKINPNGRTPVLDHEPYIATSRFLLQHRPDTPERAQALSQRRDGGWAALKVMEEHLGTRHFLVDDYTIADFALFAYTHISHEGGFPLDDFPNIRAWIERVKARPRFVPMI